MKLTIRTAATLSLLSLTASAIAQYAWLDDRGVKQFSDMPPPASVPQNHILKQPRHPYSVPESSLENAEPASKDAAAVDKKSHVPMTLTERNADFMKRRAEQEKQEAKAAEEAKNAEIKAKNCQRAQSYYRTLTSGGRMATTDANGERHYLSDEQRTQEEKEAQSILNGCK